LSTPRFYLMKRIADAVTENIAAPDKTITFQQVAIWTLLASGIAILTTLTRLLSEYAMEAQSLQVTDAVADILHAQSIVVDRASTKTPVTTTRCTTFSGKRRSAPRASSTA
jgi:hypothetical protein